MPRTAAALAALALLATSASSGPARHLRYAESSNRLVYAFVFGHDDSCRVIRRPKPPRLELETLLHRPPGPAWRGHSDETVVAELSFGRGGRPVHLVPSDDAKYLVAFANRAADGSPPRQDKIYRLEEKERQPDWLDYAELPKDAVPLWPKLDRELPHKRKPAPAEASPLSYAFLDRQLDADRILVVRQSEDGKGYVTGIVAFVVRLDDGLAELPQTATVRGLLQGKGDPLWRAGAAWAAGHRANRGDVAALRTALGRTPEPAPRAVVAWALVRCGDDTGRKVLRELLGEKDASARRNAALALARLEPDRRDANALAEGIDDADEETARLCAMALARLKGSAINALLRVSRSSREERRAAAVRALAWIEEPAAEGRLLELARQTELQEVAARALTTPPRAIFPQNYAAFGRVLSACGKSGNREAARRLSLLAYHARVHADEVYEGLVLCAPFEPKAIWALRKLTGEELKTPEDCAKWWKSR